MWCQLRILLFSSNHNKAIFLLVVLIVKVKVLPTSHVCHVMSFMVFMSAYAFFPPLSFSLFPFLASPSIWIPSKP